MASEEHMKRLVERADIVAGVNVGALWDRMRGEYLAKWEQLNRQGLSIDEIDVELRAFMAKLSDKPLADLARKSAAVAYNQGRAAEILTAFDEGDVQFAVRSEYLDKETCPPCVDLDGETFDVGTPEFEEFMPPAKCDGGDRCRGFYITFGGE